MSRRVSGIIHSLYSVAKNEAGVSCYGGIFRKSYSGVRNEATLLSQFRYIGKNNVRQGIFSRLYSVVKNEAILLAQVLYIDENNNRQGTFNPTELLQRIDRRKYDLVLVNAEHTPPIVRPLPRSSPIPTVRRQAIREKEFHFGTTMGKSDRDRRTERVGELIEKAYRIKLVVEGRKGEKVGREVVMRELINEMRVRFGRDLMVTTPEMVSGSITCTIYNSKAKPPSTKPGRNLDEND